MGSGKRASMREGPLAALFRKTETDGLEAPLGRAPDEPAAAARRRARAGEPTPRASRRRRSACATRSPPTCPRTSWPRRPRRAAAPPPAAYYPPSPEAIGSPQLRVVGIGGAGVNAVNRMIEAEVAGVEFVAVNTDVQSLQQSDADHTVQIGADLTQGPRLRLGPRARPQRRDGGLRPDQGPAQGLRHGLHHRRRGRRHRHRRRARRRADRPRARRADRRDRLQAVRLRGLAPRAGRRAGHPGARRRGRHADRRAEQPAAVGARQADVDGRGVPRRRRRAAPGRAGHLRPDHAARPDQPRLRRRAHDHGRGRPGAARHRHGPGREARDRRGRPGRLLAAARDDAGGREVDPAVDHRRQRPLAVGGQRGGPGRRRGRASRREHHLRRDGRRQARGAGLGHGRGDRLRREARVARATSARPACASRRASRA